MFNAPVSLYHPLVAFTVSCENFSLDGIIRCQIEVVPSGYFVINFEQKTLDGTSAYIDGHLSKGCLVARFNRLFTLGNWVPNCRCTRRQLTVCNLGPVVRWKKYW